MATRRYELSPTSIRFRRCEPQRQILFDRANGCQFMTIDEKRSMVGLSPLTDAEMADLLVGTNFTTLDMLTVELPPVDTRGTADPVDDEDEEDEGAPPSDSEENEEDEAV